MKIQMGNIGICSKYDVISKRMVWGIFIFLFELLVFSKISFAASSGIFYSSNSSVSKTTTTLTGTGNLYINTYGDADKELPTKISTIYGNKKSNENVSNSIIHIETTGGLTSPIDLYGIYSTSGNVENNQISLESGNFKNVNGAYSYSGKVQNNTLKINDGTFNNIINVASSQTGNIYGNTLYINNGTYKNFIYGANSRYGNTNNNTIYINGGNFKNNITAGYSKNKSANGNKVILDNEININKNISISAAEASIEAMDNSIILGPNLKFTNSDTYKPSLYGYKPSVVNNDTIFAHNNSLEIYQKNIHIGKAENFDNYYFILPSNIANGETMLFSNKEINLSNKNIGISMNSNANLNIGDTITLIDNANGNYNLTSITGDDLFYPTDIYVLNTNETTLTRTSEKTKYKIDISYNNKALDLTVLDKKDENNFTQTTPVITTPSPELKEETKAIFEGRLAPLSLLNIGTDTITNMDIGNKNFYSQTQVNTFGNISGGRFRLNSGSHIDINTYNLVGGFSYKPNNYFISGLFFEYGYGDYNTVNEFSYGTYTGNGNTQYAGVGILGKYNFLNSLKTHTYFDGHISTGSMKNNWESDADPILKYNTNSKYYTGHIGLGFTHVILYATEYELYTKYIYAHTPSNTTNIGEDTVSFDETTSSKAKFGGELRLSQNAALTHKLGMAFDMELSGVSEGSVDDNIRLTNIPTIKGNTLTAEYGLNYISKEYGWNIGFNIQKQTGKIEAISSTLSISKEI